MSAVGAAGGADLKRVGEAKGEAIGKMPTLGREEAEGWAKVCPLMMVEAAWPAEQAS